VGAVSQDITQIKEAEEALRQNEQRLQEAETLSRAMNSIHQLLHSARSFDDIGSAAIGEATAALGADSAALSLREGERWHVRFVHGLPSEAVGALMNDDEERHAVLAIATKQTVAVSDTHNDERVNREHLRKWGVRSVLALPLVVRDEAIGVLFFNYQRSVFEFREVHLNFGNKLAAAMSLAIENARLVASLQETERSLREADRRKNEFLAVLSHELRNPLAPVKNSLYILDRATPGGEQASRAKAVIDRQVEHLSRLVDDLLDVTRVSRNKITLQWSRLELNELVRRVAEDQRSLFVRSEVVLDVQLADRPLHVDGDSARIAQVVSNLLQNAAKFTGRGGRTRVSVEQDEARHAVIRVRDTGVGMAPETLGRLFEPFMQADASLDRSKGGLGLGLALTKGLVELHGGEVAASSEGLGLGAEFVVRLPLVPAPAEQGVAAAWRPSRRRRVLVIEDNLDAADSLREALELGDHEVAVAYNGPEGIAKARAFQPEVVFCDIGLPGMDGYDVARAFRADDALRTVMLVALSGYAGPAEVRRAIEAGFDKHLAKPPRLQALEEILGSEAEQ
jgi:signal transduction histidine kinase